ncbi:MAG: ABC transporter permease [Candidatus Thorarchaeota archaeon]
MDKPESKAFFGIIEQFKLALGLARKNITRAKYRSFLLIFGVLLTVALETGIAISVDTLYDDFTFNNRNQNYTDITVNPSSWMELAELKALANDVRQIPGVATASPAIFFGVSRILEQDFSANVLVYGIDPVTHPDIPYLDLIEGSRIPSENDIIISEQIKTTLNLEIGETVDLSSAISGLNVVDVEISGIISDESSIGNKLGSLFIIADINTVQAAISVDQRQSLLTIAIDASVTDLLNIKRVTESIIDKIGIEFNVYPEKDLSGIKADGIRAYQTAMNLVIIASFVVEFLFITNVLAISVQDRQKEIGILRTIGSSSDQLIFVIGIEILIYGLIGSSLGVFAGLGFANVLVGVIDQYYASIEFQAVSFHLSSIFATFMSGIIVALIAGLYPILIAKTMPIVQNIHTRMRKPNSALKWSDSTWKYTVGAGILLTATAVFLQYFIGPSRFLDFSIISLHFLTILMVFIGTVLIEVSVLVFLPRIAMKALVWFGFVTRRISTRNIAREFQKSLFTIMTSALALTFIIVVGSISASIIAEVPDYLRSQWGSVDIVAEARDSDLLPINRTDLLDGRSAIERSAFVQQIRTQINSYPGYVFGVDPSQYQQFAEPVIQSYVGAPSYQLLNSTSANTTNALISSNLYQRLGISLGENVSIKISGNATVNLTLTAVIKANMFLGGGEYVYINSSQFQNYFNTTFAKWFLCKKQLGSSVSSALSAARSVLPEAKEISELDFLTEIVERSLTFQTGIFEVLFIESFILAAVAQFVCILVSTLHMEREMGIMRSFGLSKRGVFSIFMAESTALGFTALIIGLMDGLIGTVLLIWYVSFHIPIDLYFPPERILFWILASFLITLASTFVPSFRSSQKNVVATISGRPMRKDFVGNTQLLSYSEYGQVPGGYFGGVGAQPSPLFLHSFTYIRQFLKRNKTKTWQVFLVLLLFSTLNYLFDPLLLLRGLIPFDLYVPSFVLLPVELLQDVSYNYTEISAINPVLLSVGLTAIIPISSYFLNEGKETNYLRSALVSVIWGFLAVLVVILTWLFFLIILGILFLTVLSSLSTTSLPDPEFLTVWAAVYIIFLAGVLSFMYQRMWAMLVYKGLNPESSLRSSFIWVKHGGGKGQLGFVILLFAHQIIQFGLIFFFRTIPTFSPDLEPFDIARISLPLPMVSFLILVVFEIGSFIILTLYQFAQIPHKRDWQHQDDVTPELSTK